jgi:hypothetical protein
LEANGYRFPFPPARFCWPNDRGCCRVASALTSQGRDFVGRKVVARGTRKSRTTPPLRPCRRAGPGTLTICWRMADGMPCSASSASCSRPIPAALAASSSSRTTKMLALRNPVLRARFLNSKLPLAGEQVGLLKVQLTLSKSNGHLFLLNSLSQRINLTLLSTHCDFLCYQRAL